MKLWIWAIPSIIDPNSTGLVGNEREMTTVDRVNSQDILLVPYLVLDCFDLYKVFSPEVGIVIQHRLGFMASYTHDFGIGHTGAPHHSIEPMPPSMERQSSGFPLVIRDPYLMKSIVESYSSSIT